MSDKMECPVCGSYSSSVLGAVAGRGEPCPGCGTDAATVLNIEALRQRYRESELRDEVERLTVALFKVTNERDRLARVVSDVRMALGGAE